MNIPTLIPNYLNKAIGCLLILAALTKVSDLEGFHQTALQLKVLPPWASAWISVLLPAAELCLGVAAVLGINKRSQINLTTSLLGIFVLYNAARVILNDARPCSCVSTNVGIINRFLLNEGMGPLYRSILLVAVMIYIGAEHRKLINTATATKGL